MILTGVLMATLSGCAVNPQLENLVDINQRVLRTQPKDCVTHADQVIQQLAGDPRYQTQRIYSCPDENQARAGICHVSALVTAPDQTQWVLDNGAVLGDGAIAVQGVSELDTFLWALGDKPYWTGPLALTGMGLYIASVSTRN